MNRACSPFRVVAPSAEPVLTTNLLSGSAPFDPYPVFSPEARLRTDVIAGKFRRIQAALACFTTAAMRKEALQLAAEIERDLPMFLKALRS